MIAIRWGIVGIGPTTEKFIDAIYSNLTVTQHKIVAIYSQDSEHSKELSIKHNISRHYDECKDLAMDELVEVAYIDVTNTQHYDACMLLLRHGKHILCESPFCMNEWQTDKVLQYAVHQELFAIGGIWSRFFPSYKYLRNMLETKEIYDIREIYIKHGIRMDIKPVKMQKSMGDGIALQLGAYAIQFALMCYKEYPKNIRATGKINSDGIDLHFEAELTFSRHRFARIVCSGLETYENQAVIISKSGTVCFPSYYCPLSLIEPDCNIRTWWIPETDKYSNSTNTCNYLGLKYEADEVAKCVRTKKIFSETLSHQEMILIARIQDEIRRQIGVRYDCDKKL